MIENIKKETLQEIKNYNKEFYDYLVSKEFKILYKFREDEIYDINSYSSVSFEYSFTQLIKNAYQRIFEEDDFVKLLVKYLYCLELEKSF